MLRSQAVLQALLCARSSKRSFSTVSFSRVCCRGHSQQERRPTSTNVLLASCRHSQRVPATGGLRDHPGGVLESPVQLPYPPRRCAAIAHRPSIRTPSMSGCWPLPFCACLCRPSMSGRRRSSTLPTASLRLVLSCCPRSESRPAGCSAATRHRSFAACCGCSECHCTSVRARWADRRGLVPAVWQACNVVLNSERFKKLLGLLLGVGNYLNWCDASARLQFATHPPHRPSYSRLVYT